MTRETASIALAGVLAAALVWHLVPESVFKARALVGVASPTLPEAGNRTIPVDQFASPAVLRRIHDRLDLQALESVTDMFVARALSAVPGEVPGTLQIFATDASADRAATIANVAAVAIVESQGDVVHRAEIQQEARDSSTLARLHARAQAARRKLASLNPNDADQEQALLAAKTRAANALARVSTIHAIMAAGSPPLSDRSDAPAAIKAAQSAYLDVMQQLAKAREALGDRHTTIVSLTAQVKRAAARLTAEWQRLSQAADHEVVTSRARLDALNGSIPTVDPQQASAIAAARRDVATADEDLARAQRARDAEPIGEINYRVVTSAVPPITTSGVPLVIRILLAGIAALLASSVAIRLSRRYRQGRPTVAPVVGVSTFVADLADTAVPSGSDLVPEHADGVLAAAPAHVEACSDTLPDATVDADPPAPISDDGAPSHSPFTTIMVAANELRARTTPVALAIGRAAASEGVRVLIVETARPAPTLASATDAIDPVIVDLFGTLRIALPADEESLYLVPSLNGGERIAAELTRRGETPVIEDIGERFDLVVIDGGCAADVAEGWRADVYLRVGGASPMADALFAATFDIPTSALLDTVVVEENAVASVEEQMDEFDSPAHDTVAPVIVPLSLHVHPRHIVSRRPTGVRLTSYGRR